MADLSPTLRAEIDIYKGSDVSNSTLGSSGRQNAERVSNKQTIRIDGPLGHVFTSGENDAMIVHYRTISLIILVGLATTALLNTLSTKYSREFVAQATSIRLSRATTSSGSAIPQGSTKASVLSNTSRRTTGDVCKHAERASANRMRYLKLHPPSFATTREMFRPVKRLLFFIGPARSGSTLMGRLLDAHPHITVTNEVIVVLFKYKYMYEFGCIFSMFKFSCDLILLVLSRKCMRVTV